MAAAPLPVVLWSYPKLSETFIAQELLGLERRGVPLHIYALSQPERDQAQPIHAEIEAPVSYLLGYFADPKRVASARAQAERLPGYAVARAEFEADHACDPTRKRRNRFDQACVLATEMPEGTAQIYAHFLAAPASVTRYAAMMRQIPYAISAHARDIWVTPDWERSANLARAEWIVTCTRSAAGQLAACCQPPKKVSLVYHGLDFGRFPPSPPLRPARDGSDPSDPVMVLSVGRATAKKGYDDLLAALAALPRTLHWRFVHIGAGELQESLIVQAAEQNLSDRVTWLGSQPQPVVLEHLHRADFFALASRIAEDGDRDGLPNVLLEAQSQGLAVLTTYVSGIPELVSDGETGRLVAQRDVTAMTEALVALITKPDERQRLGAAGLARLRTVFSMDAGLDRLAAKLAADPLHKRDLEGPGSRCQVNKLATALDVR